MAGDPVVTMIQGVGWRFKFLNSAKKCQPSNGRRRLLAQLKEGFLPVLGSCHVEPAAPQQFGKSFSCQRVILHN